MPNNIQAEILSSIADRLRRIGFRKRQMRNFVCDLEKGCTGFVGLNVAHHLGGVLEINPVVGVRIDLLEDKLSELTGRDTKKLATPTLSRNIGYWSSDYKYRTYIFSNESDINVEADRLVGELLAIGVPAIRPFCDTNKIYSEIANPQFFNVEKRKYYEPVLIAMLGSRDKGLSEFLCARRGWVSPTIGCKTVSNK